MNVSFRKSFTRDLHKIKNQKLLGELEKRILDIESATALTNISGLKKLTGTKNCYRIRVGEYRIGLIAEEAAVELVRFLHRRDIYRYFP
jgi:mRNA interferase RelE/StbE